MPFALILIASLVRAGTATPCARSLGDATVEVELRITEKGKLTLSPEAEEILGLLTIDDADLATAFAEATPRVKHEMIRRHVARIRVPYREDRRIPGLRLKDTVRLRWAEPTRFLGVTYAPDVDHDVSIAPLLASPAIDLGAPGARRTGGFIEVHLRSNRLTPAELERETWTLLDGRGISQNKAHVHVTMPIARERLASEEERFGLVNGYRYVNLAAEMISILFKGRSIQTASDNLWDALNGAKLAKLSSALEAYAANGMMPNPDEFKMSYVGFHFPNKYDGRNNFGLQFRSVDRRVSDEMASLLDDGRKFLGRSTWIEATQPAWLARHRKGHPWPAVFKTLWYREGPGRYDFEGAPEVIRRQLVEDEAPEEKMNVAAERLFEARMLTYDWAEDPLYFGDEVAIESVRRCQERAFGRFAAAREYRLEFTQDFIACAGLYERVRRRLRAPPDVR